MMSKNTVIRAVRLIGTALWWAVSLLLVLLVATLVLAHLRGEVPRIFGHSVMNIVSESMEPTIPKGSYILIERVTPQDVEAGDVICFYSTDPAIYGYPNTHRVLEKEVAANGSVTYVTQGDNSLLPDSVPAEGDRLIGRYVKTLDGLGALLRFFSEHVLAVFGILLAAGSVLTVCVTVIGAKKKENKKGDQ